MRRSAWIIVLGLAASCASEPVHATREPQRAIEVKAGGATIELALPDSFAAGRGPADELLVAWVRRAAEAVTTYYGRAPVERLRVEVSAKTGGGVANGLAANGGRALVQIEVGAAATERELLRDWTLTHEMLHLAAPDVGKRWFEEGLAVYVEPVARARAGQLREATVWKDMLEAYDQGLPGPGDKGLDGTDTWARAYYGGALFFFVADIELRKATKNARGLEHALRAIAAAGGTVGATWTVDEALAKGDAGTGTTVLSDLAKRWRGAPVPVDLRALFRELGVELRGGEVFLHEDAPLSGVRRAIVGRSP